MRHLLLTALILLIPAHASASQDTVWARHGDYPVKVVNDTWFDAERDRSIPIRIYCPDGEGVFPVIVFSHGLGGSRSAAPYLGHHWASWGFMAVFVQHPGSDEGVWQGRRGEAAIEALREAASPRTAVTRFGDIPFVLDEIEARAAAGTMPADPARMGIAGHSYGAHTVLAALGAGYGPGGRASFDDPRLTAGVALSPPPADSRARNGAAYDTIGEPVLHLTGTHDFSPINADVAPESRLEAFEALGPAPQYLIVFEGGDHAVFNGQPRPGREEPQNYPAIQAATAEATTLFFQAWLTGDADARTFLNSESFDTRFAPLGEVRRRNTP